ncbi:3-octaprenyl-4-hydroxybenzoate carboxy-lyase [Eggerthella sp. CAG:209]|nr:3-octaprenyl-4-hydroxybenzoate carboxy-lyase [Eggerthella sp. CAG:209]
MKRIVVGISGASGTHLACRFVSQLKQYTECEVHVVVTDSGRLTASYEEPELFDKALALADNVHSNASLGESIASGTFKTEGMVIIPCSMKTVAGIASGYSDNLLLRAADVTLKEQRPLVLVARETPMNAIHLRNLAQLASVPGITLMPPMMTYYHNPQTIDDMEDQLIGKIFDRFGLEYPPFERWS